MRPGVMLVQESWLDRWRGFPIPVFGVFGSEFCERFSYFCMQSPPFALLPRPTLLLSHSSPALLQPSSCST